MIVWILVALAFLAPPIDENARLAKARQKLKNARQVLDDSERALARLYMNLDKEFDAISGPNCSDFIQSLTKTWIAATPEIRKTWKELSRTGRRVSEKRFLDSTKDFLANRASDVTRTPEELLVPFLNIVGKIFYDAMRHNRDPEIEALNERYAAVLTPYTPFHEFWNTHLFTELREARAFADANNAFAEAKAELDRLERPSEFGARGRRAPPGMVIVPGGFYYVGPNTGWDDKRDKRRKVKLRDFYIDKYEVTNKEFNFFLRSLDEEIRLKYMPYFWPVNINHEKYYPEDRADHPVIGVSWEAANAYALWKGNRLPTEEEWEVAASGGKSRLYPWGSRYDPDKCNTIETGIGNTTEVGSFLKGHSLFGCHDMAGNAAEWTCSDQDGKVVKVFEGAIMNVVIRGGSFREESGHACCRYRWMTPMSPYEGSRPSSKIIGFRCVRDAK